MGNGYEIGYICKQPESCLEQQHNSQNNNKGNVRSQNLRMVLVKTDQVCFSYLKTDT